MLKKLSLVAIIALTLAGCANKKPHYNYGTEATQISQQHFNPTNAVCIKSLDKSSLHDQYTVIGKVSASTVSFYGIKRQRATIDWLLDQQAAKMGGDALIEQHKEGSRVVATVIRFNHPAAAGAKLKS